MATDAGAVDTRRRIYEFVVAYPGLHLREVARRLALDHALVDFHLRALEREGLVAVAADPYFKRYFPATNLVRRIRSVPPEDRALLGLLRSPIVLNLLVFALDREFFRHRDAVEALRLAPSTVSYHLRRLCRRGLLAEGPRRGSYRVADRARVLRLLYVYRPIDEGYVERFARLWRDLS